MKFATSRRVHAPGRRSVMATGRLRLRRAAGSEMWPRGFFPGVGSGLTLAVTHTSVREEARGMAGKPSGSVFKRRGCRRGRAGLRLGASCPRLAEGEHGSWFFSLELPRHVGGARRRYSASHPSHSQAGLEAGAPGRHRQPAGLHGAGGCAGRSAMRGIPPSWPSCNCSRLPNPEAKATSMTREVSVIEKAAGEMRAP